jgi:nucleoside-diphosphate-sugar epimerase
LIKNSRILGINGFRGPKSETSCAKVSHSHMSRRRLILITGATGAVGPLIVKAFHAAGYSIRTLSIDPPTINVWPDEVETLIGDVTDLSAVRAAMQDVQSVIHLAALLHVINPPQALEEKYQRINVGGTATVVSEAIRAGAKRVVFFSTIAVYGHSHGRVLTEDTPPYPDTIYSQTKLAAEKIVLEAKDADGCSLGTVLRLGAVYGPRVKGNYQRLLESLVRSRFIPVGNGSNRRTLVYDKDVARAAVLASEHPNAAGKIFNVSDGEFHSLNDIIQTMCKALGREAPRVSLPVRPVRFAAGLVEDAARLVGYQPPIRRATIDKYTEDTAVDSQRIQEELGFVPKFDLVAGWKDTIQEMRRSGQL